MQSFFYDLSIKELIRKLLIYEYELGRTVSALQTSKQFMKKVKPFKPYGYIRV